MPAVLLLGLTRRDQNYVASVCSSDADGGIENGLAWSGLEVSTPCCYRQNVKAISTMAIYISTKICRNNRPAPALLQGGHCWQLTGLAPMQPHWEGITLAWLGDCSAAAGHLPDDITNSAVVGRFFCPFWVDDEVKFALSPSRHWTMLQRASCGL